MADGKECWAARLVVCLAREDRCARRLLAEICPFCTFDLSTLCLVVESPGMILRHQARDCRLVGTC